jgi:hypothetical protein
MTLGWVVTRKNIEYSPSRVPGIRSRPLSLKPVATGGMKLRVSISGINQHYRPRALAAFHGLVQGVAVGNINERTAAVECRQGD